MWRVGGRNKCDARIKGVVEGTESEHCYECDPWTIISVHTNGTIRVQHGIKSEGLNVRRVIPYFENYAQPHRAPSKC